MTAAPALTGQVGAASFDLGGCFYRGLQTGALLQGLHEGVESIQHRAIAGFCTT